MPAHAAYERYRKELLEMGFDIYEARPDTTQVVKGLDQTSTLHTKLIVIDSRYSFIGSLNLDPRSIVINTELGILVDSPELANALLDDPISIFGKVVYKLHLNDDEKVEWHGINEEGPVVYHNEPHTNWWR
ncbi:phospholipase D-like domain-containing protein [Pseudomaricurvus hydrocarbonicus]|uniref:phospholipase D-like domain-containing protein n=1 Tax=Pseudomaricurvus hydrocarbonicus TaxID=1470433 RepID=UPI00312C75B4